MIAPRKLRIHAWGGLGSQLYAWALAEILLKKTKRNITLVLHSSGVTRRTSDLNFLRNRFEIVEIDDYSAEEKSISSIPSRPKASLIRKFVLFSKLVVADKEIGSHGHIFPWTREIRGHYTNILIPSEIIMSMLHYVQDAKVINLEKGSDKRFLIHYRLGDLLSLSDKKPIPPERFLGLNFANDEVFVASDSLEEAVNLLEQVLPSSVKGVETSSPWNVLDEIIRSAVFIGTPSKISFWGIAMRKSLDSQSPCAISREHLSHLKNLTESNSFFSILTY